MILVMHHLMGAAEIGELFGVSRQRVQQLIAKPDFPKPDADLAMGKVWKSEDVRAWGVKTGRLKPED
jgi:predicted DNA-binding transcriptional regulator AlpA